MQKMFKRFMLIGAASLFLAPAVAFSQEGKGAADLADVDWTQMKMSQEQAEEMAKMLFAGDIAAGRLTQKQAGEYFKCTEEDYAVSFKNSPEGKRYGETLNRMKQREGMSASEKAKQDAEMQASTDAMEKIRGQSEDKCVKQIGLKAKPQLPHQQYLKK